MTPKRFQPGQTAYLARSWCGRSAGTALTIVESYPDRHPDVLVWATAGDRAGLYVYESDLTAEAPRELREAR